jgi:apolipoprotein D and lipocalin family protein
MIKPLLKLGMLFVLALTAVAYAEKSPVNTVNPLSLSDYSGTWYEVARTPNWFQRSCASNSTEFYTLLSNGRMGVKNICTSPKGVVKQVTGEAWIPNTQAPGKLKVSFFKLFGRYWFPGDYWVLGTDTSRYAVVGGPDRRYGWILSRTPQLAHADKQASLGILKQAGYDICRFQQDPPATLQRVKSAFCP